MKKRYSNGRFAPAAKDNTVRTLELLEHAKARVDMALALKAQGDPRWKKTWHDARRCVRRSLRIIDALGVTDA